MSMHLRGSRDVMGKDESWWQSRTGLEQKLVILSTVLFILAFSLMISVIVIKNRSPPAPPAATTVSPTAVTGDTTTVTPSASQSPSGEPTPPTSQSPTEEPTTSTNSTEDPTLSTNSTGEPTPSASPAEETSALTSEASSTSSPSETTGSPELTTPTTPETPPAKKSDEFASGSINNRPARYISPKARANLNGA